MSQTSSSISFINRCGSFTTSKDFGIMPREWSYPSPIPLLSTSLASGLSAIRDRLKKVGLLLVRLVCCPVDREERKRDLARATPYRSDYPRRVGSPSPQGGECHRAGSHS